MLGSSLNNNYMYLQKVILGLGGGSLICICLKYKIFDKWILSAKLELPGVVIFCFICYGTNIESVDTANFVR